MILASAADLHNRTISCGYKLKLGQRIRGSHVRSGELMSDKILSRPVKLRANTKTASMCKKIQMKRLIG